MMEHFKFNVMHFICISRTIGDKKIGKKNDLKGITALTIGKYFNVSNDRWYTILTARCDDLLLRPLLYPK